VSPLFPVEHSVCPHDIYDWWIERYGRNLDAFWPVVDTEIGRLGIMMANEGSYPENARALALNGAEVVYRASYPHPAGNETFEIQSRARALDNNMYLVAPNMGTYYLYPEETTAIDTFGGRLREIDVVAPPLVPFLYPDRILRSRRRSGVGQYATSESSTTG
jgi:beta-ureidopropionase